MKKEKISHWIYNNKPILETPEEFEGFVYLITCKVTDQRYIGKKIFWSKRTLPPLKGKKRKRKVKKESDWKEYTSSSVYVAEQIAEHGIENFTFEILTMHETRGEANYHETKALILNDVLESKLPNGNWKYLNENIERVWYKSERFQEKRIEIKQSLILG